MEINIQCLIAACDNLNIGYQYLDINKNFVMVELHDGLLFKSNVTPFNTEVMSAICKDKEYSYRLLHNRIAMPKTIGFIDFNVQDKYHKYVRYNSKSSILDAIEKEFTYPVVVKKNRGALGINVFLCQDRNMASLALEQIFNRNDCSYDYIALAQEYIQPEKEFRAVFFRGECLLCYQRISEDKKFGVRYWDTNMGHALDVDSPEDLSALAEFVHPSLSLLGLDYIGFDIIKSIHDKYFLIELNSGPKFNNYVDSCGPKKVIAMYEKILLQIS